MKDKGQVTEDKLAGRDGVLLVVHKPRHGEGPGEELHPLAELCDAGHRLCVLQQKGLEAGQVPFERKEEPRQPV